MDGAVMPRLWGHEWTRVEVLQRVGTLEQIAGVRLVTLGDGVERGVRLLEFRTGSGFAFDVIVDRAFDIARCEINGRPLSWLSGVGFAGPWFYEPEGFGFLRTFAGGLLTTCGLDHTLFQTEDTAEQYHYPPKQTERFGLHGRVANRPGRLVGYGERWEGDECILWAEGEVLQASALGEHLLLHRRIEVRVGESSLRIHDEVENIGFDPTPHMYLYHVNIGFPVVDEGAEVLAAVRNVTPCGDYPVDGYRTLTAPIPGYTERVFEHSLAAEVDGTVPLAIVNRRLDIGLYQLFRHDQFPFPFMWRNLAQGAYVVALEPSTNRVGGRHDARDRGELIELAPGERRRYDLELGALPDSKEIERFESRVLALGGQDQA